MKVSVAVLYNLLMFIYPTIIAAAPDTVTRAPHEVIVQRRNFDNGEYEFAARAGRFTQQLYVTVGRFDLESEIVFVLGPANPQRYPAVFQWDVAGSQILASASPKAFLQRDVNVVPLPKLEWLETTETRFEATVYVHGAERKVTVSCFRKFENCTVDRSSDRIHRKLLFGVSIFLNNQLFGIYKGTDRRILIVKKEDVVDHIESLLSELDAEIPIKRKLTDRELVLELEPDEDNEEDSDEDSMDGTSHWSIAYGI